MARRGEDAISEYDRFFLVTTAQGDENVSKWRVGSQIRRSAVRAGVDYSTTRPAGV